MNMTNITYDSIENLIDLFLHNEPQLEPRLHHGLSVMSANFDPVGTPTTLGLKARKSRWATTEKVDVRKNVEIVVTALANLQQSMKVAQHSLKAIELYENSLNKYEDDREKAGRERRDRRYEIQAESDKRKKEAEKNRKMQRNQRKEDLENELTKAELKEKKQRTFQAQAQSSLSVQPQSGQPAQPQSGQPAQPQSGQPTFTIDQIKQLMPELIKSYEQEKKQEKKAAKKPRRGRPPKKFGKDAPAPGQKQLPVVIEQSEDNDGDSGDGDGDSGDSSTDLSSRVGGINIKPTASQSQPMETTAMDRNEEDRSTERPRNPNNIND